MCVSAGLKAHSLRRFDAPRFVNVGGVSCLQDTSVLRPGLHIGLILTLAFIIFKKSSSQLFENHPFLYLLAFGLVIAKISNKLVVRLSLSL